MSKQPRSSVKPYSLKTTESDLERQCSDLLALDGWRTLKTDPVSDKSRGKGFGELGMADRLYIRYWYEKTAQSNDETECLYWPAEVMWIEWKSARGTVKPHQKTWQMAEKARGALVVCTKVDFHPTFEGFCAWYAKSGLLRRSGLCKTG